MKIFKFSLMMLICICILTSGTQLSRMAIASDDITLGLPVVEPAKVGVSAEKLGEIRTVLQGYVDKGNLPGFLTVIARKGQIAHFETIGMRDVENEKPIEPDTIFRIYSMSKPITSVAVMILFDDGKFTLDDPVEKFIPAFKDMKVFNSEQTETHDAKTKMTIKHLLTHTSGLTYGWGNRPIDKLYGEIKVFNKSFTLADMAKKLGDIPLVHEPGTQWEYGVSTDILGYLVEVVSRMPFEAFLQKRLFEPLGMSDTAFSVPKEHMDRFASLYSPTQEGKLQLARHAPLANDDLRFFPSGGGGLVSTAADYLRFCQMFLNGGELDGVRILKSETVELMRYPHHQYRENEAIGLGFHVLTHKNYGESQRSSGVFSWSGAAATTFWIDPDKELVAILMTQLLNNRYPFHGEFKSLTYQALED